MTNDEKHEDTHKDVVQKAFEEGLEQGYWVGRMISEALGRNNSDAQSDDSTQEVSPLMKQIRDIAENKGVELE